MTKKTKQIQSSRQKTRKISIPEYTLGEEIMNAVTHGVGALLAIAGLVLCLVKSNTAAEYVASALYGSFTIILYVLSCVYHSLHPKLKGKKVLRVLDHDNVFLMVAGTYMPIWAVLLDNGYIVEGWVTFGIVWLITILAIVFSSIDVDKYSKVGAVCNLVLGWGVMILAPILSPIVSGAGIWFLLMGGIAYSLGAILYGVGSKIKWMHSIFHFYVLFASVLHFFFIFLYCL